MTPSLHPRLAEIAAQHPAPLVFASVSGAHLYGFASHDSDWDLRGAHVLPLEEVAGLARPRETIEQHAQEPGFELDLVSHDVGKFLRFVLKPNGYVLEQILSPLMVRSGPAHEELGALARKSVTRRHAGHYLGFAASRWKLFSAGEPPRVKPLLYLYRVLLTGIHLMRSGEIEANLERLNESFRLAHVADLIAAKRAGEERTHLAAIDREFHRREYARLEALLEDAAAGSALPAEPTTRAALGDLLLRLRGLRGSAK